MFDASELITQREVVSQRVNELLQERAESFHLLLDDISIVRIANTSNVSVICCSEYIDPSEFRSRVHRGSRDEASGPARCREGTISRREGGQ